MHTPKYITILVSEVGWTGNCRTMEVEVEQMMKCLLAEMKAVQQDRCQPSKDDCQPGVDDSHDGCLASK
jgi:hypothetical protein